MAFKTIYLLSILVVFNSMSSAQEKKVTYPNIPQAYQFAGADGGASGFDLNLSLARPVAENVTLGVSFKHAQAISWHRDVDSGCADSAGVNTATSAGRNTCSANELQVNIDWNAGSMLANINVRNNVNANAQNNKKMTFNLGYRW